MLPVRGAILGNMTDPTPLSTTQPVDPERLNGILAFLQDAEKLKDTLRSGSTSNGRPESTAEHSWRLALMCLLFDKDLPAVDLKKLLALCIIHDLGEAISGDIPAPMQQPGDDRAERERQDFEALCVPLPKDLRSEMLVLYDEYCSATTPEARLAKGFDKLETMLQHLLMPTQSPEFYEFNLTYGKQQTEASSLLRQIREVVDAGTRAKLQD